MEESICISSDSDSSCPPGVDFDDDFEFPTAKLSEICGGSTSVKTGKTCAEENPKSDVFERFGKPEVSKTFLSSLATRNGSDLLFDDLPGPSCSQPHKSEILPKASSFHELSDSDSSEDTVKPDSPKSTFGGAVEGILTGNSPIWDLVDREIASKKAVAAPVHELSDSDSDQTIPAVGSPGIVADDYPTSDAVTSTDTLPPAQPDLGRFSDNDSPPIRRSNFKFDVPLSQNTVSCDTLPPGSPFVSLSDDSTQPWPSTASPPTADSGSALLQSNSEPLFSTSYSISEFITQLGASSQPLDLNNGAKPSRKRAKQTTEDMLERKRLKEMKEKEKAEKAAAAESLRRLRPGECLKVGSSTPAEESHVIFLWSIDKLLTSIQFGTFIDTFAELKNKYSSHKLLLAVYGLHEYYKKQHKSEQRKKRVDESRNQSGPPARKRKSAYEVTETQIEMELIALQVRLGISHKALNSPQDAAGFLQVITKSVAELPFKLERERIDEERNWYAKGDSRNCIRIDKDFNGLSQLWLQQLAQYNNSSLDTAKAIAQIYPTPLSLYNAYKEKDTAKEKEQMLQEIVIKRGSGGGGRRLGPELSKKISIMFCQDEDVPLG